MNKQKLISYIRLINTPGVGPVNFKKIISRFGNAERALEELSRKRQVVSLAKAEEELMTAEIKKVKIISIEDDEYPYNLKQIEDAPPLLYAKGNFELLNNSNMLAVVGSRNASLSAKKLAEKLSSDVANRGLVVVSGMARGIDAAAHKGALSANGNTIAVLGTGVNVVYPRENQKLYDELAENGLILSEFSFHTQPQASNFPRRNRIVSGLSKSVIVIEAGIQSGSLITAHQALEQGRDVYAVPGAPYDGRASGCNQLLKNGAILVENADDVIDNFCFSPVKFVSQKIKKSEMADLFEYSLDNAKNNSDIPQEGDGYLKLLSMLSESGEDIDELIRTSGLPPEKILTMIVELELEDKIVRLPGNKVARS